MTAVSINIPVETVIDFEDEATFGPQSLFANSNNDGKTLEDVARDEEDGIVPKRQMTIGDGLHPLLASMKLFGLYFNRRRPPRDSGDEALHKKIQQKWNAGAVYGAVVVTLL